MGFLYKETSCYALDDFLALGQSLGELIPSRKEGRLLDILVPYKHNEIKRNSLSQKYGLNAFPAHTDCAYFKTPPKYILLRYVGKIEVASPTIILKIKHESLSSEEYDFLHRAIWLVNGNTGKFYSRIIQNGILRYDPEVMNLVSNRDNLMATILQKVEKSIIHWTKNKVLILNNWRCLHYRPKVEEREHKNRIIQRLNIK